jgi:hypothetical protein
MAEQRKVDFQQWLNQVAPTQKPELQVPCEFRPFTLEQVCEITGCLPVELDRWIKLCVPLGLKTGSDGITTGLDYMQTLAVFTGVKYLRENAPQSIADHQVNFVACMTLDWLHENIAQGRTFLAPQTQTGLPASLMIECPNMPLAKRLQMSLILAEFRERLDRVFPPTAIIPVS